MDSLNTDAQEHTVTPLVHTEQCRIDQCSCGTVHVRVRNVSFKLSPAEFVGIAAAIGMAGTMMTNLGSSAN